MFLLQRYDTDYKKWVTVATYELSPVAQVAFDDYVNKTAVDKFSVRLYIDPDDDGRGWSVASYTPVSPSTGEP